MKIKFTSFSNIILLGNLLLPENVMSAARGAANRLGLSLKDVNNIGKAFDVVRGQREIKTNGNPQRKVEKLKGAVDAGGVDLGGNPEGSHRLLRRDLKGSKTKSTSSKSSKGKVSSTSKPSATITPTKMKKTNIEKELRQCQKELKQKNIDQEESFLYVQMAEDCFLVRKNKKKETEFQLITSDIDPETYVFADRPFRSAFEQPTKIFFERFDAVFADSKPNSAITLNVHDNETDTDRFEAPIIAIFLSAVDLQNGTYTYTIEQSKSQTAVFKLDDFFENDDDDSVYFEQCSIFIDSADGNIDEEEARNQYLLRMIDQLEEATTNLTKYLSTNTRIGGTINDYTQNFIKVYNQNPAVYTMQRVIPAIQSATNFIKTCVAPSTCDSATAAQNVFSIVSTGAIMLSGVFPEAAPVIAMLAAIGGLFASFFGKTKSLPTPLIPLTGDQIRKIVLDSLSIQQSDLDVSTLLTYYDDFDKRAKMNHDKKLEIEALRTNQTLLDSEKQDQILSIVNYWYTEDFAIVDLPYVRNTLMVEVKKIYNNELYGSNGARANVFPFINTCAYNRRCSPFQRGYADGGKSDVLQNCTNALVSVKDHWPSMINIGKGLIAVTMKFVEWISSANVLLDVLTGDKKLDGLMKQAKEDLNNFDSFGDYLQRMTLLQQTIQKKITKVCFNDDEKQFSPFEQRCLTIPTSDGLPCNYPNYVLMEDRNLADIQSHVPNSLAYKVVGGRGGDYNDVWVWMRDRCIRWIGRMQNVWTLKPGEWILFQGDSSIINSAFCNQLSYDYHMTNPITSYWVAFAQ